MKINSFNARSIAPYKYSVNWMKTEFNRLSQKSNSLYNWIMGNFGFKFKMKLFRILGTN